MHDTVPVLSVGTAQVDDIGIEYLTVFFIESNPLVDQFFGRFRIIEARTTVTGLHTGPEEVP